LSAQLLLLWFCLRWSSDKDSLRNQALLRRHRHRKRLRRPRSRSHCLSSATQIPAHYESAPPSSKLNAVLAPEQFSGKAREAYRAVREAPQLIAQMPCYCHCDRGLGHKSLHSCFEDDHAANCATCIDEALMAYQLQKRGMSPTQIRKQIIDQFGD